jgi:hypothetical protein
VTDLFKIYKTRIWMSAINPASFVTPTSSLNAPPPYSAIHLQAGRNSPAGRRRQQGHNLTQSPTGGYGDAAEPSRGMAAMQGSGLRNAYFNPYQGLSLGNGAQQPGQDLTGFSNAIFSPLHSQMDPFASYTGHHYGMLDPNAPTFSTSQRSASKPGQGDRSPGHEWTGNFRSLTLGGN